MLQSMNIDFKHENKVYMWQKIVSEYDKEIPQSQTDNVLFCINH